MTLVFLTGALWLPELWPSDVLTVTRRDAEREAAGPQNLETPPASPSSPRSFERVYYPAVAMGGTPAC